jgi:hypothetical protein
MNNLTGRQIRQRVVIAVAVFLVGLLLHELCVKVFVDYVGPEIAIWGDGVLQTLITIWTIHYLVLLNFFAISNKGRATRVLEMIFYIVVVVGFWMIFSAHVHHWWSGSPSLGRSGWILFIISCMEIFCLSLLGFKMTQTRVPPLGGII